MSLFKRFWGFLDGSLARFYWGLKNRNFLVGLGRQRWVRSDICGNSDFLLCFWFFPGEIVVGCIYNYSQTSLILFNLHLALPSFDLHKTIIPLDDFETHLLPSMIEHMAVGQNPCTPCKDYNRMAFSSPKKRPVRSFLTQDLGANPLPSSLPSSLPSHSHDPSALNLVLLPGNRLMEP